MEPLSKKKFSEKSAMELAIQSAEKGRGLVSPNPPVGCVILDKDYSFLSSGFYSHYGSIHAEISALNKIKDKKLLKGAHIFVTLEPCAHFGKNPPCVDELLKYPFASLSYGREDPNPKTKSKGLQKLKEKGFLIKKFNHFQKQIQRMYESFSMNMEEQRAFFALKTASSLDGVSSFYNGESQWITGKESRDFVSCLRADFSAVLIGVNTFLEDNPRLNCRKKALEKTINKVCLLDPSGKSLPLIPQSRLATVRPLENIFVITQKDVKKEDYPFQILRTPLDSQTLQWDLKKLSFQLYQKKICSVLIEGGEITSSHFLKQKAIQRLYHFINPSIMGGLKGRYWTESLSIPHLGARKKLKSTELLFFGEDICITGLL